MPRIEMSALAWLGLILAVLVTGCESAPYVSQLATPTVAVVASSGTDAPSPPAPLVRVDGDLTPVARIGEPVVLELSVSNVGPRDIHDLTIVVNDAYLAEMIGVEATPNAIRYNQMGGEYFAFRTLPRGVTEHYVIRMSPDQAGDFLAKIDVVEWSSWNMAPLSEVDGGVAEFTSETQVLSR